MIRASISYGFGEDNKYKLKNIPCDIQLAMYKYELYQNNKEEIFKTIKDNNIFVNVVHLPLDSFKIDSKDLLGMIEECRSHFGCLIFVLHPNRGIENFIGDFRYSNIDANLCIENFPWKRKKVFRSPLEITQVCHTYDMENLSMVLDTSHTEEIFFDYKIMSHLLQYTSVIHLSNKIGKKQHLPFNIQNGDLNLVGFVKNLKNQYNWSGDIVLEYMPAHHHKLIRNYEYLQRLIT